MAEAILTLPDDSKVRITGATRAEVMQKAQRQMSQLPSIVPNGALRPLPADGITRQKLPGLPVTLSTATTGDNDAFNAGLRAAGSRAIENVLGIPDVLANFGLKAITGQPLVMTDRMRERRAAAGVPELPEINIPLPSGSQVVAGLETAAEVPGALLDGAPLNLQQRFQQQQIEALRAAQEHPVATAVGGVVADAATIAGGRVPARGLARAAMPRVRAPKVRLARPGIRNALDTAATKLADTLGKGALKAGEAGLEGATLALLQDGDPLQTAAFAAGAQSAGSLILASTGRVRKHPVPATFMALLLGHQLFKAIGPGERNLFESSDDAINEIIAGYGLGILANLAGFNRIGRKGFAKNFPESITDSLTAIPRGALTSFWEDLAHERDEGGDTILQVIDRYTAGGFNDNQRKRIERAFNNGNLASEVEKMMGIQSFRDALDE